MREARPLETSIEALLADSAYEGHPLRQPLADLYAECQAQLHRLERITSISDQYQTAAREVNLSLSQRYGKHLRQLEKLVRITDRYQSMMRELNVALKEASATDALTGLGNRRMLMEQLKSEVARWERMRRPFAIAIADIDHFKEVNDTYGHEGGDKVLTEIAQILKSGMREYDCCGRWGGEEFLIVLPEATAYDAGSIIERLRHAIETSDIQLENKLVPLSASFGIAEYFPGETISDLINRADAAMYAAKRAGRNRHETSRKD
ncbi:biofilm regulation diguanylate cyclase SiaD [Glaciimonas sp. PCH181]|uniref:biofilm regulation diguanylate cyclase SiaD n=1 Tax=Glaciimonas sp. PCH181 TaxID=2133943 RepID=UPI000D3D0148|nr:biofilm regulation diguanylate cyclase SiaD [Glaciimonas sp. PCH181]PUA19084.1 GGDEF domain-containing protein [Glaciimonas sp. PCH181]